MKLFIHMQEIILQMLLKKIVILSIYENVNNLQANKILKWDCVRKLPFLIYIHFFFFF